MPEKVQAVRIARPAAEKMDALKHLPPHLLARYNPKDFIGPLPRISPTPKPPLDASKWPLLARWIARHKQSGEIGIGDTLERLLRGVGGAAFKRITKRLRIECGCGDSNSGRQGALNRAFPYPFPGRV